CLAVTLGILAWSGHARYWHVAVMAVLWGIMSSIDQPARQSLVMELVGRAHVTSAVGLNSAAFNGARIIGPAIAGVLIARVGLSPGFFLNALAFVFAIAMLAQIPSRRPVPRIAPTTFVEEMLEGVLYAARTPAVRFILTLQIIVSFCVFNFSVYVPLLARDVLGMGAEGFGLLMTCLGVGALSAGLSVGAMGATPPRPAWLVGGPTRGPRSRAGLPPPPRHREPARVEMRDQRRRLIRRQLDERRPHLRPAGVAAVVRDRGLQRGDHGVLRERRANVVEALLLRIRVRVLPRVEEACDRPGVRVRRRADAPRAAVAHALQEKRLRAR